MELKQQQTPKPSPPSTASPPAQLVFRGCGLLLLTSPFRRTPLLINPNNDQLASAFRNFHSSVASNADRVLKFLHQFASQNPLIRQLSNLSSHFDSFRQIHCRNNLRMNSLSRHNFAAVLPGDSVAGVVVANGVLNFLNIYNILLTVR
ncbi:YlmG homolog protein 2, chloroplastic-like protein, partial [Drosera capensis]